jgi:stress-induced-phosphoprotein 1
MLAKLAGHPKFGPKLADPKFVAKLQGMQKNPQLLMSDPEMMEVFQAILGTMGGPGGEDEDLNSAFPPSPSPPSFNTTNKRKEPTPVYKEPEPELNEEERQQRGAKENSRVAKEKGNALYKEKRFPEALLAYDEAISLDPSNLMVRNNKAAVYIEMNQSDQAIAVCESIFEEVSSKSIKFSFEDRAKVYQRIAAAHIKKDDVPEALKAYHKAQMENFDKAIERKIKNMELEQKKKQISDYINPTLGLEAKERGNTAFREANYPEAITQYEDAVKRDPTNAPYHNNLAAAYQKMV